MTTLKEIAAAIAALFVYLAKIWPTWTEGRQNRMQELKNERIKLLAQLREWQLLRDSYLYDLRWLFARIDTTKKNLRRCNDKLRSYGAE